MNFQFPQHKEISCPADVLSTVQVRLGGVCILREIFIVNIYTSANY
jgi:hypothetical protein